MTDDEAFIRRIVDSPGDDTPRLVYADWLDERNDPRGAYLRAESEAIDGWSETGDLGSYITWLERAPRLAAGLDPVWVARVSRPPVGVFSERLYHSASASAARAAELDEAESGVDVALPPQYRALLLNYALGRLKGGPLVLPRPGGVEDLAIDSFVCLSDPEWDEGHVSSELVERTVWLRDEFGLDQEYLYLASTPDDDTTFVVSARETDPGSVHVFSGYDMEVSRVADSVGEFLAMLHTRSRPLTNADD